MKDSNRGTFKMVTHVFVKYCFYDQQIKVFHKIRNFIFKNSQLNNSKRIKINEKNSKKQ